MKTTLVVSMSVCSMILNSIVAVQAASPTSRPAHSGVYALWYGKQDSPLLDAPYITGGQVFTQWADLEPEEGKYDFSPIDDQLKALKEKGLAATVQINGNKKPTWLFERVPYHPEKLHKQVNDKKGTLMYWHPNHVKAYTDFVRAYAEHMKKSPYLDALIGVRLNYNAVGTELTRIHDDKKALSQWIVPKGVEQGPEWTEELANQYQDTVVQTFVDVFTPDILVFVRSTVNEETHKRFENLFQTGVLGWFHTSSRAEQPNAIDTKYRNQIYIDYCRTNKTLGYNESSSETWKTKNPLQWNYWRGLNQLHSGVSFLGTYAQDLEVAHAGTSRGRNVPQYQQGFKDAYVFHAKYAGYHASPKESPGAWVAFRDGKFLKGDYTFLMERLPDDKSTVEENVGPKDERYGMWARILQPGDIMRLRMDEAFSDSLQDAKPLVRLIYLDKGKGAIKITATGVTVEVRCQDSGKWERVYLSIDGAKIANMDKGGLISIEAVDEPAMLHMVEVMRERPASQPAVK